jgi:HSP20 family protein
MMPFEEMEKMFESRFPWRMPHFGLGEWPSWKEMALRMEGRVPKVDVIDRDHEVAVRAELPGVDKKDLDVSMTENSVTIKASTKHEEKEEKGDYYRCEISQGSYARTVSLPSVVDTDQAKASFKDGILELVIPKIEKSRKRTIEVK